MAAIRVAPSPSIDIDLAGNLAAARIVNGFTQDALSAASGFSRATIAPLESGHSDPRISTIEALAKALNLTPAMLLFGFDDLQTLGAVKAHPTRFDGLVPANLLRQLEYQLDGGSLKDRTKVAESALALLKSGQDLSPTSIATAAIFAAILPDPGLAIGAAIGLALKPSPSK